MQKKKSQNLSIYCTAAYRGPGSRGDESGTGKHFVLEVVVLVELNPVTNLFKNSY